MEDSVHDPETRYQEALQAYFGWLGASIGHVLDVIGPDTDLINLIEQTGGDLTLCFRGYREEKYLRQVFLEYEQARDYFIDSIVAADPLVRSLNLEIQEFSIEAPHYLIDRLDNRVDDIIERARESEREHMADELARLLDWD